MCKGGHRRNECLCAVERRQYVWGDGQPSVTVPRPPVDKSTTSRVVALPSQSNTRHSHPPLNTKLDEPSHPPLNKKSDGFSHTPLNKLNELSIPPLIPTLDGPSHTRHLMGPPTHLYTRHSIGNYTSLRGQKKN